MIWIDPLVVTGPTATGRYYFPRPELEAQIWSELEKGGNVLLAAPRRVGKSSVMQAMELNPAEGTRAIFRNIQGIKSEDAFYKMFYELLVTCLSKYGKGMNWLKNFTKGITIEEITLEGVKFGDAKSIHFETEIERLFSELSKGDEKIVLLIDELPEVLNNLFRAGRTDEASSILNKLRQWRQNPVIKNHVGIVLAGSVGIHHIVKRIEGRVADINDFIEVPFPVLNRDEAATYVQWATNGATVQYNSAMETYLLDKLQFHVPYFMSLMLEQVNRLAKEAKSHDVNSAMIDTAFDAVIKNNKNFSEWSNRIVQYFQPQEAQFIHDVLALVAHKDHLQGRDIYNLAQKNNLAQNYMDLMNGLEADGYLMEKGGVYRFISPFLQAFWKRNHPIFE